VVGVHRGVLEQAGATDTSQDPGGVVGALHVAGRCQYSDSAFRANIRPTPVAAVAALLLLAGGELGAVLGGR